jgi:bifunctional isochorismate lyase/aryl carrier protein
MVNDYFLDGPLRDQKAAIVNSVNQLSGYFRNIGFPVIWIRQEFSPDLSDAFPEMRRDDLSVTIAGTEGAMLLTELDRAPDDFELIKKRYSAFFETELDSLLTRIQANPIILTGINTHACIRMTAIDAYQRDLEVIVALDCVRSYDEEHHRITLNYLDGKIARVLSNAEIEAAIMPKDDDSYAG